MKQNVSCLEEFIYDSTFVNWVNRSDWGDVQYWDDWLEQNPDKKQLAEDAAMLVKGIALRKQLLTETEIADSWIALQAQVNQNSNKMSWLSARRYQMAAVVALLLTSVFGFWYLSYERTVYYTTQFGEISNIVLPDSSKVTLNANSTLSFTPSSLLSHERKVHLTGEAFFQIRKKSAAQPVKFMVITANAAVEVLGTQFNVNSRRGKTSVVLNTGRVKFNVSEDENALLEPGDRIEYSVQQQELILQKVDPELYSSWRKRILKFDDTSLETLVQILEDNYGLQVIIENKQLQDKRITGEISGVSADIILKAVSKLFKIQVSRNGNTVYFS